MATECAASRTAKSTPAKDGGHRPCSHTLPMRFGATHSRPIAQSVWRVLVDRIKVLVTLFRWSSEPKKLRRRTTAELLRYVERIMEVDDTRPGFDSSESELASDETSQSHTASDELASDESAEEIASDESGAENPSSQRGAKEAPFPSQVGRPSAIKTSAARRSATGALQPKLRVASPRRSILVASSGQVYTPSLLSAQRGPYRGVKDGLQQSVQPLGTNQQEASVDQSCAAIATSPASSDSDDCDITAAAARAIAAGGNPQ